MTFIGPLFTFIATGDHNLSSSFIQYVPLITTLGSFVGNIFGVFVVANKFGRKTLLIAAAVLLAITNIGCGICMLVYSPLGFLVLILI